MVQYFYMKKDELKFLYIIIALIILIIVTLFFILINIQNGKIKEKELENSSLQKQLEVISKTKRDEPIFQEAVDNETKQNSDANIPIDKKYIGKWKRISMTINGISEKFSQAILEIKENSFVRTTNCSISGGLSIDNDKMIMSVKDDGCKEGKNSFVNNYNISPDGKKLILSINDPQFVMTEEYERVPQD